jgi:methionine-S-sulfoxide reductase
VAKNHWLDTLEVLEVDEALMNKPVFSRSVLAMSVLFAAMQLGAVAANPAAHPAASSAAPAVKVEKVGKVEKVEKAYFAAGCFWKVQYVFSKVPGVLRTKVGYTGGTLVNPTYEQVCSHTTGHAEAVEVEYDPAKTSFRKLLEVFFAKHDPTTKNRQGPDVGDQYRSAIFYVNDEQKKEALAYEAELTRAKKFNNPIVTLVVPATKFYVGEEYHQNYQVKHGQACD